MSESSRNAARAIFTAAIRSVDVRAAVRRSVSICNGALHIADRSISLDSIDQVLIVAMGKAAVPMFEAAAASLADMECKAIIIAPPETLPLDLASKGVSPGVRFLPGSHPTPSMHSLQAADAVFDLLSATSSRTVVLFLISGGASAMVERPLDAAITVDDLATFSRALVGSGLNIGKMNTMRKHLSAVKGGRIALAAGAAAMQCTLLISDVPEASADAIASGPSLPDSTTVADARRLFAPLKQAFTLPASIVQWFEDPWLPETPKADHKAFNRAHWQIVLSSEHLAEAARKAAEAAGFSAIVDNTCDDWEYRDAARYLLDRSQQLMNQHAPFCLISVGEVSVNVPIGAGHGGRNQHFALWCATELGRRTMTATVLSAGSDGVDGQSDAAGAVCDESTEARAARDGYDPAEALDRCDTAPLLRAIGDAIHTGPTGNNLRDLRLVLVTSLQ